MLVIVTLTSNNNNINISMSIMFYSTQSLDKSCLYYCKIILYLLFLSVFHSIVSSHWFSAKSYIIHPRSPIPQKQATLLHCPLPARGCSVETPGMPHPGMPHHQLGTALALGSERKVTPVDQTNWHQT